MPKRKGNNWSRKKKKAKKQKKATQSSTAQRSNPMIKEEKGEPNKPRISATVGTAAVAKHGPMTEW